MDQWNALKLLNSEGEFLTAADGAEVLRIAEAEDFHYAEVDQLGTCTIDDTYNRRHIDSVLQLKLVDVEAIRKRKFRVCADTINSVGGIILPEFFQALGLDYEILNGECTGDFAHKTPTWTVSPSSAKTARCSVRNTPSSPSPTMYYLPLLS